MPLSQPAAVKEIKRSGQSITTNLDNEVLREGDTLVVMADDSFELTIALLIAKAHAIVIRISQEMYLVY